MKIKKILTILVVLLLAVGIGYYIYWDLHRGNKRDEPDIGNISVDLNDFVAGDDNMVNGDIENLPSNPINKGEEIPQPSLGRPILKIDSFGGAISDDTIKEIEKLIAKIKEGGYYFKDWNELALYRKMTGDYDGAREIWEYMTKRWPDNFVPYLNLGNLYGYYIHDNAKAEEYYKKATEKDPSYIATYLDLSAFYREGYTEKADLADDILLKGLENNPGDISLQMALAVYYAKEGDVASSRKYYDLAIAQAKSMGDTALESQLQEGRDNLLSQ